jgi:glycosyltransferase involved in cell wall biosynthesis
MDLCVVTNRFIKGEGQGRVNYEIARQAARAGHRVTCVAHKVSPDLHVRPQIEWAYMPDENWPWVLPGSLRFARQSTKWLRKHGDEFDLIIGNGCNTWFPVDLNIVHFVHSAWRKSPVHDARQHDGPYGWYQWTYSTLHSSLEKRILPRAEVVVAVSRKVKRELVESGVSADRIQVIHNGVDLGRFQPGAADRSALGLPADVPLALFVGDIQTPRKNLDSVLRALTDVSGLHLAIAGSTDGSPFPALADRLGVSDRTHFLGFRSDVAELMRASDLFVFPSRYEACSLVLLEAMASGLPIVTASTTGGAELVGQECGVVLDDPDDIRSLRQVLRRLVNDPTRRASMGAEARTRAEDLSWSKMADRYLELVGEAIPEETSAATA